jgi:hypothetical protein
MVLEKIMEVINKSTKNIINLIKLCINLEEIRTFFTEKSQIEGI